MIQRAFPYNGGTATRAYTFNDFFIAKPFNMINNPIGVGIILSILVLISIFIILLYYKSMKTNKRIWSITILLWLFFTFLGVNSMTFHLPVGLFAFRFWMLFAIPVSIIVSEGLWFLFEIGKAMSIPKLPILIVILAGIILTSGYQKFAVNTTPWQPGQGFGSPQEAYDLSWISTIPANTKIYSFCGLNTVYKLIGFDQFDCGWCPDVLDMGKVSMNKTTDELYTWMRQKNYKYTIIDADCVREFGMNKTNEKLQEMISSAKFQPEKQAASFVLLRVS
jgi:hypothetical protein